MSPNERFAVALLGLVDTPEGWRYPLVSNGRPNYDAIDELRTIASTGEQMLLTCATEAWRGFGLTGALSWCDKVTAARALAALNDAYQHLLDLDYETVAGTEHPSLFDTDTE